MTSLSLLEKTKKVPLLINQRLRLQSVKRELNNLGLNLRSFDDVKAISFKMELKTRSEEEREKIMDLIVGKIFRKSLEQILETI
jgi:hypothetical protein